MTTIISQDTVFAAVDTLWTDANDLPAPEPFKKFYVLNDSIIFFSGFVDPILAVLAGYVTDLGIEEEFMDLMAQASELDGLSCSIIEVERKSGKVVYQQDADRLDAHSCVFYGAGSGSDHALRSLIDGIGIISATANGYDFESHGQNLINNSMQIAFKNDCCSGGDVSYITWSSGQKICDCLNWIEPSQLSDYNGKILSLISERFQSKEAMMEIIAMHIDEEKQDAQEFELEAKIFDLADERSYSPMTNLAAKGKPSMSDTTNKKPRVAVKTSGSSQGKVFSASSLKARIAQRKAEGLS